MDSSTIEGLEVTVCQNKQYTEPFIQPIYQPKIIDPAIYSVQIEVKITINTTMKKVFVKISALTSLIHRLDVRVLLF